MARSRSSTVNVTGRVADSPGASAYNRPSGVANFTPGLGLSQRISDVPDRAPPLFQKRTLQIHRLARRSPIRVRDGVAGHRQQRPGGDPDLIGIAAEIEIQPAVGVRALFGAAHLAVDAGECRSP